MKISWQYNRQTEIERLVYTANNIALGTYPKIGFLLAEKITETKLPNVVFPSRNISQKNWELLAKITIDAKPSKIPQEILSEFKNQYSDIPILTKAEIFKLQNEWGKIEKMAIPILQNIFSELAIDKLVIIPTLYGTPGSFYRDGKTLYKIIRMDYLVENVIRSIVQIQIKDDLNFAKDDNVALDNNQWYREQEITDYLMRHTKLKELFAKYRSLIDDVKVPEADLEQIRQSNEYYRKLGFPVESVLTMKNDSFYLFENRIKPLSQVQKKLLEKMLGKSGEVITFEEIAQIIWGENYYDKYSLSTMTKVIFRLRKKLKIAGLQKEVIFTKRGEGYVLVG